MLSDATARCRIVGTGQGMVVTTAGPIPLARAFAFDLDYQAGVYRDVLLRRCRGNSNPNLRQHHGHRIPDRPIHSAS
jgi:hypothetical protein